MYKMYFLNYFVTLSVKRALKAKYINGNDLVQEISGFKNKCSTNTIKGIE